jgi:hypothetical protein
MTLILSPGATPASLARNGWMLIDTWPMLRQYTSDQMYPLSFIDIPVSTTCTLVFRARPLVFSRVAFLVFAYDHGSFELIWNLSVPGSSRPVSQACLSRQSFAQRGLGRPGQKPRSRVRPREREGEGDEKGVVSSEPLTERSFAGTRRGMAIVINSRCSR